MPARNSYVAFERLTGADLDQDPTSFESPWRAVTDHLIAWDLQAPPGYQELKARLFLLIEPAWEPLFADRSANIDWRWVSWGGVLIDDVVGPEGPVAFPLEEARTAVTQGVEVELGRVRLRPDGSGFRAQSVAGEELATHQAFWFAWS